MDAKELLRQYLEQRRELGESEFVLDALSVDDALAALGARDRGTPSSPLSERPVPTVRAAEPPAPSARTRVDANTPDDWREALRAAGAAPSEAAASPALPISPSPQSTPSSTHGLPISIGSASTELFGGPLAKLTTIDEVAGVVAACQACGLYATATHPVPGEGNPNADLVCVGEAPGATEDEQGRPFVGAAGQLLTKILEAGMQIPRENVFICNVLKHRPPGNRNPAPDEIVACRPYLMRQLELIRPKVILALGTFAAQTLLETKLSIGKLRGHVHTFYGIPLVVTYHPAALLRNPAWKRPTYEDVQLARRLLDRTAGDA